MNTPFRSRWLLPMFATLLLATSLGCACGGCYLTTITPLPPPCPMETLLMDVSLLPEQLDGNGVMDPADRFGVEFTRFSASNSHDSTLGGVTQTVYREWSERKAQRGYNDLVDTYFYPQENFFCHDEETKWEVPSELTYRSRTANQSQLGCTVGCTTDLQTCQYIAQYGVYVVWYYARMSEVVTFSDFERILQDIDRRMANCLD